METEFQRKKNLHDLEYNTQLNYLNIALIILGTLLITFLFSFNNPDLLVELCFKLMGTFIAIFLGVLIFIIFNDRLKKIKKKIEMLNKGGV